MSKAKRIDPLQVLVEIAVITVGIVLAYQLNGMRETNKTLEAERNSLIELKSNLSLDLIDLEANIRAHENALSMIDTLRGITGEYQEDIGKMFFRIFRDYLFVPQTSAFESLKAKGVDLITNDDIRIDAQRLYDFYYEILITYESDYKANQLYDDFEWVATTYYNTFPIKSENVPEPKQMDTKWLNDPELTVRIDIAKHEHRFSLSTCEEVKKRIEDLIIAIEKELETNQ